MERYIDCCFFLSDLLAEENKNFVLIFLDFLFHGIQNEIYLAPVRTLFKEFVTLMGPKVYVSDLDEVLVKINRSLELIQV
jgi:hypothetical protein